MTKKITPEKAREALKKSAENPVRHHRVGGKKTEVATEMVLNAAGKSRSVYSYGVVDLTMTGEKLRDVFVSDGIFPNTTVADLFRLGTGCYWSKVDNHIKYAKKAFSNVSPFEVEFQPLGSESSEMTKPPWTKLEFHHPVLLSHFMKRLFGSFQKEIRQHTPGQPIHCKFFSPS